MVKLVQITVIYNGPKFATIAQANVCTVSITKTVETVLEAFCHYQLTFIIIIIIIILRT